MQVNNYYVQIYKMLGKWYTPEFLKKKGIT